MIRVEDISCGFSYAKSGVATSSLFYFKRDSKYSFSADYQLFTPPHLQFDQVNDSCSDLSLRDQNIILIYMGKFYRLLLLVLLLSAGVYSNTYAQNVAAKTNFAHWAAFGSPNLSVEVALNRKLTVDTYGGFNLWKLSEPKEFRHWAVQPELRYWFCDVFNGHFIGLHGHGGQFNIGGIDIPVGRLAKLKDHRYEGYFYGAGLSYGYQWILNKHWNIEASLGGGYARVWYKKFPCVSCGEKLGEGFYNYWGVTRATLSLVYVF